MTTGPQRKRYIVILDRRHDRQLDKAAHDQRKSRSQVVRDALDRMLAPVPDADEEPRD